MEQNFTMQDRINEMYKYAFATGKVASKQAFAELGGISREALSRFLTGKTEPSRKTLTAINTALGSPFNEQWMVFGTGDMLATAAPSAPTTHQTELQMLIQEMRESRIAKDEQIDKLLNIIANMQTK